MGWAQPHQLEDGCVDTERYGQCSPYKDQLVQWHSYLLSFWKVYERKSAPRLAFLLSVSNFQFLKVFTDNVHLAELGSMNTWMMPAIQFWKSFNISLTGKWNNANVFQIILPNSLWALCIENLFCVWGQRFVTQNNNWWIEIQKHSAQCTSLLFAGTGSGWIILQMMYFPCFTFPINPLPAYTLWVWGCSWPPHVDQKFFLLKAFCCCLASDCSKSLHTNLQATVSFQ